MDESRVTPTGVELAPRLRLAVMRLARRMRQAVDEVTQSQISAMSSIERLQPVSLGDLAAAERVQPPTMTRIVAALEEQGLVVREVDADDRRISRVYLTPAGRRLIERSRTRKTAYLAARLRSLGPEDAVTLERAIGILERINEDDR